LTGWRNKEAEFTQAVSSQAVAGLAMRQLDRAAPYPRLPHRLKNPLFPSRRPLSSAFRLGITSMRPAAQEAGSGQRSLFPTSGTTPLSPAQSSFAISPPYEEPALFTVEKL